MKIEFLTQDDPLYILPFFEEFFRSHGGAFETAQVSLCPVMGRRSRAQLLHELVWLYGPAGFLRLASRLAFHRVRGRGRVRPGARRCHSIEQLCGAHGVPCERVANPNDPSFVDAVRARGAAVLVSVACPFILRRPLLEAPPLGCINIHHAPLPRYKGMMPTFWQMYHGERTVGVTVHRMAERLDEGDALLQESLAIEPGESLDHLIRRSKRHGAHCVARVLEGLAANALAGAPMDHAQGSYFTFPTRRQMVEFRRRGLRAI